MISPIIRILLRYGVGALFTYEVGDMLSSDPDVLDVATAAVAAVVGVATEWWYARAKKSGGAT